MFIDQHTAVLILMFFCIIIVNRKIVVLLILRLKLNLLRTYYETQAFTLADVRYAHVSADR